MKKLELALFFLGGGKHRPNKRSLESPSDLEEWLIIQNIWVIDPFLFRGRRRLQDLKSGSSGLVPH